MRSKVLLGLSTAALVVASTVAMPAADGQASGPAKCHDLFDISPVAVPSGLDPLTASDAQLAAAHLPPRPEVSDENYADELGTWKSFVTSPIHSWSCSDLTVRPVGADTPPIAPPVAATSAAASQASASGGVSAGAQTSHNWAGWQATTHFYTTAEAEWYVPTTETNTSNLDADYSQWVGIGEGTSDFDPLVQAGTDNAGDDTGSYYPTFWWEVWCGQCSFGNGVQTEGFTTAGDEMYVQVHASGTSAQFVIEDLTSGYADTFRYDQMTANFAGTTAEWIGERPTRNGYYTKLGKTAALPLDHDPIGDANAAYGSGPVALGDLPRVGINMYPCSGPENSSTWLMSASALTSNTGFHLTWHRYGTSDQVSSCGS